MVYQRMNNGIFAKPKVFFAMGLCDRPLTVINMMPVRVLFLAAVVSVSRGMQQCTDNADCAAAPSECDISPGKKPLKLYT